MSEKNHENCRTGVLNAIRNYEEKRFRGITEGVIEFLTKKQGIPFTAVEVFNEFVVPNHLTKIKLSEVKLVLTTLADEEFLEKHCPPGCTGGSVWFYTFEDKFKNIDELTQCHTCSSHNSSY